MKLGIIGYGMVGKAVANGFKCNDLFIADPLLNTMTIPDVCALGPDFIMVCVPTPTRRGKIDVSILDNTLDQINKRYSGVVVIKSTTPPDKLTKFEKLYTNLKLVHNPELLSDRTANEDFVTPNMIIIGSNHKDAISLVKKAYIKCSVVSIDDEKIFEVDLVTASLLKYGFNTFYATKITFMNEMYKILKKSNTNTTWNEFKKIYGSNPWIGGMHIDVPGHDGYFGYGGKCFPKDTEAFAEYASNVGHTFELLEKTIELNKKFRDE